MTPRAYMTPAAQARLLSDIDIYKALGGVADLDLCVLAEVMEKALGEARSGRRRLDWGEARRLRAAMAATPPGPKGGSKFSNARWLPRLPLDVDRWGIGWAVFDAARKRVTGVIRDRDLALAARDRMEREVAPHRRKCISCDDTFDSEGPHHRMCDRCRHVSAYLGAA